MKRNERRKKHGIKKKREEYIYIYIYIFVKKNRENS